LEVTQEDKCKLYNEFFILNKNWTPSQRKNIEIQIGSNPTHIITRINFFIKLVTSHIIHCTQGLTLECLVFNPFSVTKHGFTYTTLSCVYSNKHLYLLFPLSNKIFDVTFIIEKEMSIINNRQYKLNILFMRLYQLSFYLYNFKIFIC